jgi:DNA-3-methyladenine glycosylase II
MWKKEILVEGPYDFGRAIRRIAFDPLTSVDLKEDSIKVPLWIDGDSVVAEVKAAGSVNDPRFTVLSEYQNQEAVLSRLADIFKWDVSLSSIYDHFALTDLKPLFEMYRGTPLICDFGLYRCLMKSIIHQQLNLSFANTLTDRFAKTFGFEQEGVSFYPAPEQVGELSYDDLRKLQFSQRKAEYVIDTSKLIASGELSLEKLGEQSNEEIVKELVNIRGIGPWTAESVLLFGLGRENLLPAADVGLQNAVKNLYGLENKPTQQEMREMGKEWVPYQSYASLYLWESLGNHSVKDK